MLAAVAEIGILLLDILPVAVHRAADHIGVVVVAAAAAPAMMAVDMAEVKRWAVAVPQVDCRVRVVVVDMDLLAVEKSRPVAPEDTEQHLLLPAQL